MEIDEKERMLLRELSNNSRSTVTNLSEQIGCSRITTSRLLRRLVEKLKIRFTLELNTSRLGISERHIVMVKFARKPDVKALRDFFGADMYSQNVYLTEGDYDLLIYAVTGNPVDYIRWETKVASELSEYGVVIRPSEYVFAHFGYMPLSNDFVGFIDKYNKQIDDDDKRILSLLNQDSRMGYREMAEKLKMKEDTIRYRIFTLRKSEVIRRFTIAVQEPIGLYPISYFINYRFNKTTTSTRFALARESYMNADDHNPLLNTFQFVAPISGSYRSFGIALFKGKEAALEGAVTHHQRIFNKEDIEITYAGISGVIKGLLPFRNLDIRTNYVKVEW